MSRNFTGMAAIFVSIQIATQAVVSPAAAISADLAKKCREMAIKAHPPEPVGTSPYAQLERDFFSNCVAKNGEAPGSDKEKGQTSSPR
jgi:hypothetical protein